MLLGSDLTFHSDSVAVWLRSPKVVVSETGTIVEVWRVDSRPDLDPISTLKTFLDFRSKVFGNADQLPVFLKETGFSYTHGEFNSDLALLLSLYPQLQTSRDKWQGHSFRAGISTHLSLLGFEEDQIKSWGRWSSDAYLCYLKDLSARRNVQAKFASTFTLMLQSL